MTGEEGRCLADRERELWRPSQMSGLGLGSVLGVCGPRGAKGECATLRRGSESPKREK